MQFFDLHCDTITECYKNGAHLKQNNLHLDIERGSCFEKWVQCFAIWIPDSLRGDEAWNYFERNFEFFLSESGNSDVLFCKSAEDLSGSESSCSALLSVEGGAVLTGEIEKLEVLYNYGVRLLTLTWNAENELGFGCQSGDGHLKPFGKDVVREMEKQHMIVDVSHLNRTGFYDVLSVTDAPIVASHSTSATVLKNTRVDSEDKTFALNRALEDDQIRALSERKGLIGLNFCGSFLGDVGKDGFEAAIRHADHILNLGGEDILAIGSDYDGCTMAKELSGIENIPNLYDYFAKNGFGKTLSDKIFFDNAFQFTKSVL